MPRKKKTPTRAPSATKKPGQRTPAFLPQDVRSALIGGLAIVGATVLGGTILFNTLTIALLGLLAGALSATAMRKPANSGLLAFAATFVGVVLAAGASRSPWGPFTTWGLDLVAVSVAAAIVAVALAILMERQPAAERLVRAAAVVLVLGALWYSGIDRAMRPAADGSTLVSHLSAPIDAYDASSADEDLYLSYVQRLANGRPYYSTVASSLAEVNSVRPNPIDAGTPLSYRPPTLYWLLAVVPGGGWGLVVAGLVWSSLAAVSAYFLAARLAGFAPAIVGATVVGAYCAGMATDITVVYTEWWAGVLGLASVALLVAAARLDDASAKWLARSVPTAAPAAALGAALVRELAVAFIVLGLTAVLFEPSARGRRLWIPWVAALGIAVLAYVAHWAAASSAIGDQTSIATASSWLHPDGLGLVSAMDRIGRRLIVHTWIAWIAAMLAIVGGYLASDGRTARLALLGCALGGALVLAVLYPTGAEASGLPPSYWADVVIPAILACAPLALVAVAGPPASADAPRARS